MTKKLKISATTLILIASLFIMQDSFAANSQKSGSLKIVDQTNVNFDFMGICGEGVIIKGNPNLKSHGNFTFLIAGKSAKGEIGYFDKKHNQVINFVYNYVRPGGYVTVKGGEKYYKYSEYCTFDGNEIVITNKQ